MNSSWPRYLLIAVILLATFLSGAWTARAELVPSTDNFCFFLDHSSSMLEEYEDQGAKIALAKNLMADLNRHIPQLPYKGALFTFAPFRQYRLFLRFERIEMLAAISRIDTTYSPVYTTRTTPMGEGLQHLEPTLARLEGRIDLIVFTDGGHNVGYDAIQAARDLSISYGDRLCIHVVSFAQSSEQIRLVESLSRTTPCGVLASAKTLLSPEGLEDFAAEVFFDSRPAPPVLPVEMESVPEPQLRPLQDRPPDMIVLRGVRFDFDDAAILPESEPILDVAAETLRRRPELTVSVQGHTCSLGPEQYNQALSERRARAVTAYLIRKGIDPKRLSSVGFGESKPRFDNVTLEGRARNRRVELVVVP